MSEVARLQLPTGRMEEDVVKVFRPVVVVIVIAYARQHAGAG